MAKSIHGDTRAVMRIMERGNVEWLKEGSEVEGRTCSLEVACHRVKLGPCPDLIPSPGMQPQAEVCKDLSNPIQFGETPEPSLSSTVHVSIHTPCANVCSSHI